MRNSGLYSSTSTASSKQKQCYDIQIAYHILLNTEAQNVNKAFVHNKDYYNQDFTSSLRIQCVKYVASFVVIPWVNCSIFVKFLYPY